MSGLFGAGTRRRVWQSARAGQEDGGFCIMLDQVPLRLPGGRPLQLSSRALADAVAAEWSQAGGGVAGGVFGPDSLVLTRLAATLQERVTPDRDRVVALLLGHAGSDLLCYRALQPPSLTQCQQAAWQPWVDWCATRLGAPLIVTAGVMPVAQPAASISALHDALRAQDDAGLTALGVLVPTLGSLVLGLAVAMGALDPDTAIRLALLDELHQLEHWGADAAATERHQMLARDVAASARFMSLSRDAGR